MSEFSYPDAILVADGYGYIRIWRKASPQNYKVIKSDRLVANKVPIDPSAANRRPIGVASYLGKVRVIISHEGEITRGGAIFTSSSHYDKVRQWVWGEVHQSKVGCSKSDTLFLFFNWIRRLMKDRMKKLLLVFPLLLLLLPLMGASATKSLVIDVAEDAYVVADLNDPGDAQGLREKNYGSLEFVKTWYLWNVVEEGEQEVEKEKVVSVIYLKFDLSPIEDKRIESAMLQLYAKNVVLLTPRFVQVFLVSSDWSEATVNFNSGPGWGPNAIATTAIYQSDYWYGWDVTDDVVRETRPGQISLAVMLRDMDKAAEELVAFSSREAGANVPRLVVTYTESGVVVSWYWWLIGGLIILALIALAFFGGLKLRRRHPSSEG